MSYLPMSQDTNNQNPTTANTNNTATNANQPLHQQQTLSPTNSKDSNPEHMDFLQDWTTFYTEFTSSNSNVPLGNMTSNNNPTTANNSNTTNNANQPLPHQQTLLPTHPKRK